jgi:hypothetical protein
MWKNGKTWHHGGYVVHFTYDHSVPKIPNELEQVIGLVIDKEKKTLQIDFGAVHACGDGHSIVFLLQGRMTRRVQAFEYGIAHIKKITTLPHQGEELIWELTPSEVK